ncbi:tetratricopeptide repeat protein [Massilia sp. ST3]|uniref:O-linked N-acetylglucosamine transferase, SPINDLY family protein n=1 Tax=Massilia sp. ST3 TaxID=2824903 RepID=UPI001B814618|nr:tetratricopeptide repeat protein [Massilia sp. ST3]MBQ5946378.1 tetratricopeptide repeat protein [Massilia sp. ST3]
MPAPDDAIQTIIQEAMQAALREAEAGQLDQAGALYRAVLDLQPGHAGAHFGLGWLALQAGRLPEAIPCFATAVQNDPAEESYWLAYIDVLMEARQFATARELLELGRRHGLQGATIDAFEQQLASAGAPAAQEIDAAADLYARGQFDAAGNAARALTERFPQHAFGWKLLGAVLYKQRAAVAALEAMRKAVSYAPDDAEALTNLGLVLKRVNLHAEAEGVLERAIALKPDSAHAHNHLAATLLEIGRLAEAQAHATTAKDLDPHYLDAWHTLALVLDKRGRSGEALDAYRWVLERDPDNVDVRTNMLFCLSHMESVTPAALFEEHRLFGQRLEARVKASRHWENAPDPERPLRVGIVSGDLRNHAVSSFAEPLFGRLAGRPGLVLHAYYTFPVHDAMTARLRGHMAQWRDVSTLDDAALDALVRADGIDILIDLSGHTSYNRLSMFARKPAPLQASWIGYPGTTGLAAMDYYITDRHLLPPGQFDHLFTEKLALLPVTIAFAPAVEAPEVAPLPALANGYPTFASFNRVTKISREVIALWARLLRALPDARLLVGGMPQGGGYEHLHAWLQEEGIDAARTRFQPLVGMRDFLPLYGQVDICLDTFPYSGGTTTMYALYMGVPTLTLAGDTMAGRQTACLLEANGLRQYIAVDGDDFVAKGLAAAGDLAALAALRPALRADSPLWRPDGVTRLADSVELALRMMWRRWCAGLPAQALEVPASRP